MQNEPGENTELEEAGNTEAVKSPVSTDKGRLEKGPDHVPTLEEVEAVIGNLMDMGETKGLVAENAERTIRNKIVDEKGLYNFEVQVPAPDPSEKVDYGYRRFAASGQPEIHIAFYVDGVPMSGHLVATCVDGEWKYV